MSDLAKKCADRLRRKAGFAAALSPFGADGASAKEPAALAAFIEAAQVCRAGLICVVSGYDPAPRRGQTTGAACNCSVCKDAAAYDAALRDLAQSMEAE